MVKVRKSREQKIKAQLRHFDYHYEVPTHQVDKNTTIVQAPSMRSEATSYPYLKNDLLKTVVVTGAILGFQMLAFILLKNNIISIPGTGY
jgi:hypothetical protein